MGRPAKARQNAENGGRSVPPRQEIDIQETADSSENVNIGTESAQSAADGTEAAQSTADGENPSQMGTEKQMPLTKVKVIRQDLITTTLVLDTLPESPNGPLATIIAEMRRIRKNVDQLSDAFIKFV